jgi:hypothetical protein
MKKNILLFCLCLTMAFLGYKTSIATKEQFREVKSINYALNGEKDKADVLIAEWTYLNRSERLSKLAEKHLELKAVKPEQIFGSSNYSKGLNFADMGFNYQVASVTPTKKPVKI